MAYSRGGRGRVDTPEKRSAATSGKRPNLIDLKDIVPKRLKEILARRKEGGHDAAKRAISDEEAAVLLEEIRQLRAMLKGLSDRNRDNRSDLESLKRSITSHPDGIIDRIKRRAKRGEQRVE